MNGGGGGGPPGGLGLGGSNSGGGSHSKSPFHQFSPMLPFNPKKNSLAMSHAAQMQVAGGAAQQRHQNNASRGGLGSRDGFGGVQVGHSSPAMFTSFETLPPVQGGSLTSVSKHFFPPSGRRIK